MNNDVVFVGDLVEANGKTVRENNLNAEHTIPLGAIVEVSAECVTSHRLRMFVVQHSRDCDGTPLYSLSFDPEAFTDYEKAVIDLRTMRNDGSQDYMLAFWHKCKCSGKIDNGYSAGSLIVIDPFPAVYKDN